MSFLTAPIFTEFIFPFLLVFILVFAILEKTKLLGSENKQINALISLVLALIFIAFEGARLTIVNLVPLLAVALVIILVFFLLYGFVGGKVDTPNKGIIITGGILILLFLIWAVLMATGSWDYVVSVLTGSEWSERLWANVLVLVIIGGAIAIVLATGRKE